MRQALHALALENGLPPATLACAWLLHKGVTSPIAGASKAYQIDQAADAVGVTLTQGQAALLEAAYQPRSVFGHA